MRINRDRHEKKGEYMRIIGSKLEFEIISGYFWGKIHLIFGIKVELPKKRRLPM